MGESGIVRATEIGDLERVLAVSNAVFPRDPMTLSGLREMERQARALALFAADVGGETVGAAHVALLSYTDVPLAAVSVLPPARGRGVGISLYRTISAWAREHGASSLRGTVMDDDPDSLAWTERRGFRERSRELLVELELEAVDEPAVVPPPGVEITTWAERPDVSRALWEVAAEAWPDIPGSEGEEIEPYDEWLRVHMQGAADRPEATFVALADDEVVGYAKLSFWDALPDTVFHDLTGVRRAWRGRGVARALKHAQVAYAKREGYARLRTANEQRNEPIRRLNEELGYRPVPGFVRLEGPLSDA